MPLNPFNDVNCENRHDMKQVYLLAHKGTFAQKGFY